MATPKQQLSPDSPNYKAQVESLIRERAAADVALTEVAGILRQIKVLAAQVHDHELHDAIWRAADEAQTRIAEAG